MPTSRRTATRSFVVAAALGLLVVGCGADAPSPAASGSAPSATTGATGASGTTPPGSAVTLPGGMKVTPVQVFSGPVDQFYEVPDPLPTGEPGELIRVQPVSETDAATTVRIMYHSRDGMDRDRAVTGMLTYPKAAAPDGGWPVVSLANGTVGLAAPCALSRGGRPAPTFGVDGVGVVTDYIGLGPVGETHPYLSKPSEGHSVIDAVRAAGNLAESHAGTRWLAVGHSQGGHGALSASELSDTYAPELDLLGTVAVAPAAGFDKAYGGSDDIVRRIVGVMGFYGAVTEHPELDPADYVGPETAAAATSMQTGCLDQITAAMLPVPADTFWSRDPFTTEPARSIMLANDVGDAAVDSPVLLISGTADQVVVLQRVLDLEADLCAAGQVTEYLEIDGATHGDELTLGSVRIQAWLAARLAGEAPTDSCAG